MKYTGWAVLLIGVLIGLYGLFSLATPDTLPGEPADVQGAKPFPIAYILLPFAAIAISGGIYLLTRRGNGVIRTKNLAVRN